MKMSMLITGLWMIFLESISLVLYYIFAYTHVTLAQFLTFTCLIAFNITAIVFIIVGALKKDEY